MITIETERLILREWRIGDLEDFYEYAKNPKVGHNAGWPPHENKEKSLAILESFIEKKQVWAIVYKENAKVIGSIGLHEDCKREDIEAKMVGYVLSEDYWGKGVMSEAVKRFIKYAFEEEKLKVLSVYHYPFNLASKRVIEKCGFKFEGIIRAASKIYDGTIYDDYCYSILKEEYFDRNK